MAMQTILLGYSSQNTDSDLLLSSEKDLLEYGIKLEKNDCRGEYPCSILDLFPVEFIQIHYDFITNLGYGVAAGLTYDVLKNLIAKIWASIFHHGQRKDSNKTLTISIEGIPTSNGKNKISCQVDGTISDEQKRLVIEKCFSLPEQIINKTFPLINYADYYEIYHTYFIRVNSQTGEAEEINVPKECRILSGEEER